MKKLNLICASIAALCSSATMAGTLSTAVAGGTLFAVENFTGSFAATDDIHPGAVTYTIGTTNGIVINAGGTIYFTVRLTGATFKAAPVAGAFTGTALAVGGAGNGVVGTPILSTDKTTVMVPVTFTATATLGVGSTLVYTPPAVGQATSIVGVKTTLGTVGGKVSATASLSAIAPVVTAPSTTTSPNTGTAQAADIDGPAGTADIAVSVQAVALAVSNLPGYGGKIDLTVSPAGSDYALNGAPGTAVVAKLGSVTATDRTTAGNARDGTTAVNVAATIGTTPLSIIVTPGASQAFPVGSVLSVSTAGDQCVTRVGALAAFTATTSVQPATLTVPNASTVSGTAVEICLTKPSATNVATPITPTIAATLDFVNVAATAGKDTASGTGYALGYNGASIDVNSYWPAALTTYNYLGYTRITNTGSVPAAISIAYINPTTGVAGASVVLPTLPGFSTNVLPAGAHVMLSSAQVEAAVGASPFGLTSGRIRVTAPTNALKVQSWLQTDGHAPTDYSGAQQ